MDGQGKVERTWKVRENSGNLKINSYGRQFLKTLFKREKDVLSLFFPCGVTPKLEVIKLGPSKLRILFLSFRGYGKL